MPRKGTREHPDTQATLTIVQLLAREMETWPPDQARIASRIVRAAIHGDQPALDALLERQAGAYRALTVKQFQTLTNALIKASGGWTH